MRYVFFGTPRFAAIILERLLRAGVPPVAVVCNPDRPVGRKKIVTRPPVKQLALAPAAGVSPIAVLQPETLDAAFIQTLQSLHADFFIVAAYAKIIPRAALAIPRLGTLGVHPSLLPQYRGASPIQSAILNGDSGTGVTIYQVDEKMDHGPIIQSAPVPMDALKVQYPQLEATLALLGADLLLGILEDFFAGKTEARPQDEAAATYTKKFTTDDARVDEASETPEAMLRKINAFTPEPGAWTMRNGMRIKLLAAEIKNGTLHLLTVQEEGKKPQRAD